MVTTRDIWGVTILMGSYVIEAALFVLYAYATYRLIRRVWRFLKRKPSTILSMLKRRSEDILMLMAFVVLQMLSFYVLDHVSGVLMCSSLLAAIFLIYCDVALWLSPRWLPLKQSAIYLALYFFVIAECSIFHFSH